MGNRMSSLPIAEFCGQAPLLSSAGSGRPAAMSKAFHAMCAKSVDASALMARLTEEERAEVATWKKPADVSIPQLADPSGNIVLTYEAAEKELEVGLDAQGQYCAASDPDCVTVGHLDFAWCVEVDGQRFAFVADIKRSEFTVSEGPESLQLQAYGLAYASKVGASAFVTGIWGAVEGRWWWAEGCVEVDSFDALDITQRVLAAAQNVGGDYAMGPHCRGCYGRLRCPAYVIAPSHAAGELAPFTATGAIISGEKAGELLQLTKRVKDMAEKVEGELKERVRRGLVITDGNGKVWRPSQSEGRKSLSKEAMVAAGLDPEQFMAQGKPYETWRWQVKR
jgi:hypothetical protein